MDSIDKFLNLLTLQKQLQFWEYDRLGLASLDRLRNEVYIMIEEIKLQDKKKKVE